MFSQRFNREDISGAAYENVISVAATTEQDATAFYSNYGSWIDISAPGSDIMSTVSLSGTLGAPSGYRELSGTSMACPYVAGLSGLMLSAFPEYSLGETGSSGIIVGS